MAPTGTVCIQRSSSIERQKEIWKQKKNLMGNRMAHLRRQDEGATNIPGDNSEVQISLTNLPPTVLASDIHDTFKEFEVRHVLMNFSENGNPTCEILLPKSQSIQSIQMLDGLVIDGNKIQFRLINTVKTVNRRLFEAPAVPGRSLNEKNHVTLKKPELGMINKFARKLNIRVISQEVLEASFNNISL